MALLDEQLVEEWLNRNNFYTMRGVKCGVDGIDLLALKYAGGEVEAWHVEVQVSFRPIGYLGGDTNARRRTEEEIRKGAEKWVKRKFTSDKKKNKRNSISSNVNWRYIFVCAELKDNRELEFILEFGIEIVPYKQVLTYLRDNTSHQSSSPASNISEILKYLREK